MAFLAHEASTRFLMCFCVQASKEQEAVVDKLQKQLEQLKSEKAKLYSEKIALENHLEAEQEFIMNKLNKQVCMRIRERNLARSPDSNCPRWRRQGRRSSVSQRKSRSS